MKNNDGLIRSLQKLKITTPLKFKSKKFKDELIVAMQKYNRPPIICVNCHKNIRYEMIHFFKDKQYCYSCRPMPFWLRLSIREAQKNISPVTSSSSCCSYVQ
jgi:hypothetical protein